MPTMFATDSPSFVIVAFWRDVSYYTYRFPVLWKNRTIIERKKKNI